MILRFLQNKPEGGKDMVDVGKFFYSYSYSNFACLKVSILKN